MPTGLNVHPLRGANGPNMVMIAGMFQANGTSNPDVQVGPGYTVTYVTTGKFLVTLDKTYHRCVSVVVTVGESTSTGLFKANVEEIDRTTTFSSFTVHTQSTVTDTNTDNQQVNFICVVSESLVTTNRSS